MLEHDFVQSGKKLCGQTRTENASPTKNLNFSVVEQDSVVNCFGSFIDDFLDEITLNWDRWLKIHKVKAENSHYQINTVTLNCETAGATFQFAMPNIICGLS